VLEYARRAGSSPGARDGLYWETAPGEAESPLGELAAQAAAEGYAHRDPGEGPRPYHGYLFRFLEAQGPHAPGGAYGYMARDDMIGGCAVVAWPADYGTSGVMTFVTSHDGAVYQKDLGLETAKAASEMEIFDPDDSWTKLDAE
jgi:hypothetical protein